MPEEKEIEQKIHNLFRNVSLHVENVIKLTLQFYVGLLRRTLTFPLMKKMLLGSRWAFLFVCSKQSLYSLQVKNYWKTISDLQNINKETSISHRFTR